MECFNRVPEEISLDILTRLPAETVLECKLVSTSWRNLISHHPSFSKMHFLHHLNHAEDSGKLGFIALTDGIQNFQYFEYNENHDSTAPVQRIRKIMLDPLFKGSAFVGSCNGLVCLSQSKDYVEAKTYICNPVRKEYIMLPDIKTDCNWRQIWTSGFGYVSSTNEYKVVRIYLLKNWCHEAYICTLGSGNGWRNLGTLSFKFCVYGSEKGTFANGALYWLDDELEMIITFDLAKEKFREHLPFPASPPASSRDYDRLGVLNGFLFFRVDVVTGGDISYDIWLLKKKGNHDLKARGERHSLVWSKEYRIGGGFSKSVALTKSGGVLAYIRNYLNLYDPKASTPNRLVEFKKWFLLVAPHKNTLVSLKELGEKETKIMESVEIEETESHD